MDQNHSFRVHSSHTTAIGQDKSPVLSTGGRDPENWVKGHCTLDQQSHLFPVPCTVFAYINDFR